MAQTKNIYLIGPRASGKTSLGRLLAGSLKRPFLDLDEEFVKREGIEVDVSTRSGLRIAKLASAGILPLDKIISYAVLNMIDDEAALKSAMDIIIPIVSR